MSFHDGCLCKIQTLRFGVYYGLGSLSHSSPDDEHQEVMMRYLEKEIALAIPLDEMIKRDNRITRALIGRASPDFAKLFGFLSFLSVFSKNNLRVPLKRGAVMLRT